jgi:hypothetical protein
MNISLPTFDYRLQNDRCEPTQAMELVKRTDRASAVWGISRLDGGNPQLQSLRSKHGETPICSVFYWARKGKR